MKRFQKCMLFCVAAVLVLNMAGCRSNAGGSAASAAPSGASEGTLSAAPSGSAPSGFAPSEAAPASNAAMLSSTVSWETKEFEDAYLKYQIPANWEEIKEYSKEANRLTFFASPEAGADTLSNVNIQISSLKNEGKSMDYGSTEIQKDFHTFLITEAGLPSEAQDGSFTVYQTPECYVYALSFARTVSTGMSVTQTAYVPVGLDYAIMIWATDWNDGASPSADEIALQMCATLEIKAAPAQ